MLKRSSRSSVTHSSSYLPFMFASSSRSSVVSPDEEQYEVDEDEEEEEDLIQSVIMKGRRVFNDQGEEIDPKAVEVRRAWNSHVRRQSQVCDTRIIFFLHSRALAHVVTTRGAPRRPKHPRQTIIVEESTKTTPNDLRIPSPCINTTTVIKQSITIDEGQG